MPKILGAVLAFVMAAAGAHAAAAKPAQVLVIASLHGLHAKTPTYTYDDLYKIVRDFHPDFIGVEMRQEDLPRGEDYQRRNYPKEMVDLAHEFAPNAYGFDWLGDDIAGAAVPDDWWKVNSPIKKLERALDADTKYQDAQLDAIQAQQLAILKDATPASLNDGRYDRAAEAYYKRLAEVLNGSPYEALPKFYAERDGRIAGNIVALTAAHPGARLVFVLGADHHGPAVKRIKEKLGDRAVLVPVP